MRLLRKIIPAVFMLFVPLPSVAQILSDTFAIRIITEGMHSIYDFRFSEAREASDRLAVLYPGHPVLDLFDGMRIYWENFPLLPSSGATMQFEDLMRRCMDKSENETAPSPAYEPEYLLTRLCARGLLLLFYADNDMSGNVIPLAASTYRPLMLSFGYTSRCTDFYYFTGVYNYYRDAYPQVYPVYKAVAFMFPPGDMQLGLRQLEECGQTSIALRAEAYFILSWIRLNFEKDSEAALPLLLHLVNNYPDNPLYRICYIKNLLLLKRFSEAEAVLEQNSADNNLFYNSVVPVFHGIIQEKKYLNYELALSHYRTGVSALFPFGAYGNEYAAYGYFGLSRLAALSGNNHERRINRRKAQSIAEFRDITFDY
ncbi:MAG TPA: hypothetical protein PLV06_02110 [Bacteroidales bacterium]|nr:hypothetical protein [Bacteroidales bacterium]HPF03483.1 hypothetical protein [Bacteroidales bacterium]HPJ59006.1 hypothetical protein [Bacteroidales bacterium]HPR11155.1 hypothetical protein [Bacteroidales bacterium]HRW86059.1 hypothetical protein [Bacteroidales bacterium]